MGTKNIFKTFLVLIFINFGKSSAQVYLALPVEKPLADTVIAIEEIVVGAYQVRGVLHTLPGSLSVISGDDIQVADGTNMATTLNTLPGLAMQSGTYTTNRIVIRGMGSRTPYNTNRIRAYLNEIPLTGADGVSTPEEIDLGSIGRIEVVKGPASALFGSGLGGSINLFTPQAEGNLFSVNAQYGYFNIAKANISGQLTGKAGTWWTGVNHMVSDGHRENNHYKRTGLLSTWQWSKGNWSAEPLMLLMQVNAGIPSSLGYTDYMTNPESAAANWKAINGYKAYQRAIAGVTLRHKTTEKLANQLTFFGKFNDSYEKRPFNNLDDRVVALGARHKSLIYTSRTEWAVGSEFIAEQYSWRIDRDGNLLADNKEGRSHVNLFAIGYYKPVQKVNISMALALNRTLYRFESTYPANDSLAPNRKFPFIFSPRLGVNYAPSDLFAFFASVGHGYSFPSPEEALLPDGLVNPDILPEKGMQYETGVRTAFWDRLLTMELSLYWIELNNLLVTQRLAEDVFTGMNVGKSRHQGLELLVRHKVLRYDKFPGELSVVYTVNKTINRFVDFVEKDISYNGKNLPGIPDLTAYVGSDWAPFKNLVLTLQFYHIGPQYLDDLNALKYFGHNLLNTRLTYMGNISKASILKVSAGINNLTDSKYASMLLVNALASPGAEPRYYYPGMPRHWYLSVGVFF